MAHPDLNSPAEERKGPHAGPPPPPSPPSAALHFMLYLANTVALMAWTDLYSKTPVTAFWIITLPFALMFAAVPYLLLVVLPATSRTPSRSLAIAAMISAAAVGIVLFKADGPMPWPAAVGLVGFSAQLSLLPCTLLWWLRRKSESTATPKQPGP